MEPGVNSSAALLAAAACERALANASGWDAASLARAGCEHAPVLTRATATRAAVLAGLAALSLVANAATVVSIRRGQRERRCHGSLNGVYALILHLSVADLLVTVFCIGGEAAWSYSVAWLAGDAVCKVFKFLQMFCLYLSTFVLVLIGVDRFVVVRYPMRSLSAANRLNKLIALVWGLSLVLSVPQVWDVGLVIIKGRAIYEWITFGRQKDTNKWLSLPERLFFLLIIFIILVGCDIGMMITMKLEKRRLYFVLLSSFPIRISVTLMDLILVRVNLKTTTDSYLILVHCFYVVISIYFMIVAYSYYLDMIDSSETHEESSHYCSEESPTDKDEDLKSLDPAWAAVIERREASRAASRRKEQQTLDKKRRSNTMGRRKTIHSNDGADAKPSGARNVMAMRFSIIPNTQSPSKLEIQLGIAEPSKWETSRPSCAAIGAPPSPPAILPQCWLMPPEESTDRTVNADTSEQSEEYVSTLNDSESSGTVKRRIPPSALKKEKVQNAQDHNDLEVFRDEVISGMELT